MSEFGDFLYTLRKEKGMTQAELADALGVTNKAVSKWETGESMPETSQLLPLSRIFGVSVDELLSGQRAEKARTEARTEYYYETAREEKTDEENASQNKSTEGTAFGGGASYGEEHSAYGNEKESEADFIRKHLFTRGNDGEAHPTALAKLGSAVCSAIVLVGLLIYFIIGIVADGWHPYWVLIPCFALASGIAGIIFDMCDKNRREQKRRKGENPYVGGICGMLMLTCIIVYLLLGALKDLWHPYWVIIVAGALLCGIIAPLGIAVDSLKNKNKDDKDGDK